MPDIDTVIKSLELCTSMSKGDVLVCRECPYREKDMADDDETQCFDVLSKDALELLKIMKAEQESRTNNGAFD